MNPIAQRILIRRFRPGYDYTLATNNDGIEGEEEVEDKDGNKKMQAKSEMVLEGTLCLTPTDGWEDGELGGYELSMLGEDDEDTKSLILRSTEAAVLAIRRTRKTTTRCC